MSEIDNKMKNVFENFDKAGNVPAEGFNKQQLIENKKANETYEIIKLAIKNLKLKGLGIFNDFNVNFVCTSNDNSRLNEKLINAFSTEFDESKNDLTVSVNFNFSNLAKMGSVEVYGTVYTLLYNALLKKRESLSNTSDIKFGKEDETGLDDSLENENNINETSELSLNKTQKRRHPVREYLSFLLKLILGEDFKDLEVDKISKDIELTFAQNGIYAEDLFENPKGNNLLAERYGKIVKQGYLQQSTYLLGEFTKDEFKSIVNTNSDEEIKKFCLKYVKCVLATSNLVEKDVEIKFNNEGHLGDYNDYGNRQEININIKKIKSLKNPAELIMTLQHELTHAIDSSINKSKGITDEGGYGLLDNLVGGSRENLNEVNAKKISDQRLVKDYFIRLQEICYKVNPNEISARIGELAAIKFMQSLSSDNTMKNYIDKSIGKYIKHQEDILESIEKISQIIEEFETIKPLIDIKTCTLIEDRLRYLHRIRRNGKIDKQGIKKSINIAMGMGNEDKEILPKQSADEIEMGREWFYVKIVNIIFLYKF